MTEPPNQKTSETLSRERRLRELTDQSLELLDQLAERELQTAAAVRERDDWERRHARLEEMLADTVRRVRATRALGGVGRPAGDPASVDVVYWVPPSPGGNESDPALADSDWLKMAVAAVQGVGDATLGCTLICPPGLSVDVLDELGEIPGLTRIVTESSKIAHVFNLGMASTSAPLVFFVVLGAEFDTQALSGIRGLDDESVAMGQPLMVHGDERVSLGLIETDGLAVERRIVMDAAAADCDFVAPEAFVVNRSAHSSLGPFDEDLVGGTILLEYCLRVQAGDFRIVGVPDCRVTLPDPLDLVAEVNAAARDRLVVLARHRPDRLGAALGTVDLFWKLPPPELGDLIRALFAHMPDAVQWPEGRDLFVDQVVTLARRTVPATDVAEQFGRLDATMAHLHGIHCEEDSPRLAEIVAGLRALTEGADAGAEGAAAAELVASFDKLNERLRLEIAAKVESHRLIAGVRRELEHHAEQSHGLTSALAHEQSVVEQQRAALDQAVLVQARLDESEASLARVRDERDELGVRMRDIRSGLGIDPGTRPEDVVRHVTDVRATLTSREDWIVLLLDEVQRRRIRRRKLLPHEAQFIITHGRSDGRGERTDG